MLNRIFVVDSITLTSTGTAVSSYVPFDQSCRKLPTQIMVKATGQGAYVRLSNDNSAATSADVLVQAGDHCVLSVNGRRWVSVLSDGASSNVSIDALSTAVSGDAASLSLDFAGSDTLDSQVTFTRASSGTYFDRNGILQSANYNAIRNNTMVNAIAGTPGTLPLYWVITGGGLGTLTQQIVGVGVDAGINYIDVRFSGTTSTVGLSVSFEPITGGPTASSGQTWTGSAYAALVGGSITNLTAIRAVSLNGRTGAGAATTDSANSGDQKAVLTSSLARFNASITLADATTVTLVPSISLIFSASVAIDVTLRIGMPQLERGSSAGTVTATSGTASSGARFDYNPSTLAARGLLIEESRTNRFPNNTMVGAVTGTPGTPPTSWTVTGTGNGLTRTIVGTGTENGIAYIDIQYAGTTTAGSGNTILPVGTTANAGTVGQTWATSFYVKLVGGSTANLTSIQVALHERDGAGATLGNTATTITPTSAALSTQRTTVARTLINNGTANVTGQVTINYPTSVAVDITLRIGLPQLENNNLSTGVTSATVQAGGTGYTNGDTLTVVGGTGTAATLTVTGVSTGVITSVSVATAGSYSVLPTSPVSVTGGTGSAATFNLTPVSVTGFATSVIQTSGTAATRASDVASVNTLTPWFNATEGTLYWEGLQFSTAANRFQNHVVFSDGTTSNFLGTRANPSTFTNPRGQSTVAGVTQAAVTPTGTISANTNIKEAFAYKASDFAMSFNGGAVGTQASGTLPTVTKMEIGTLASTLAQTLNGYVSRITYYPRRLSNTELQTVTS